jgi:CBS domain-containing protein
VTAQVIAGAAVLHQNQSFRQIAQEPMMLVSQIIREKGDLVFTTSPEETVRNAATLLDQRKVGAMVVVNKNGAVIGIVSERDVVRIVAEQGAGGLDQPVSSCMTRDVIFALPTESVNDLMARMTDRRVRHLPVLDGGRLVGIVSIGDLVKRKIAETEAEAETLKAYIAA